MVPLPFPPLDSWTQEAWLSENSTADSEHVQPCEEPCLSSAKYCSLMSLQRAVPQFCGTLLWDGGETIGQFHEHGSRLHLLYCEMHFLVASNAVWHASAGE